MGRRRYAAPGPASGNVPFGLCGPRNVPYYSPQETRFAGEQGATAMSTRKARVFALSVTMALVVGVGAMAQAVSQDKVRYTFNQGVKTDSLGPHVVDVTGLGHKGYLKGANGGDVALVARAGGGKAAKFPPQCDPTVEICPKALIEGLEQDPDDLNPGSAAFSFGADVLINGQDELTLNGGGMNIVQKGLIDDPVGQWKLQVDGSSQPALPSCLVRGIPTGQDTPVGRSVTAKDTKPATLEVDGIADGEWHKVICKKQNKGTNGRRYDRLSIVIDGKVNNSRNVTDATTGYEIGAVNNDAPVTVGAKWLPKDSTRPQQINDQFHGTLDNVFFRLD